MILADTSVWVDHFRSGVPQLAAELDRNGILTHPFISGELALGSMPQRIRSLREIDLLPVARVARVEEVRELIERRALFNQGIGYVDAHLLAAVLLTPNALLWTRDKRLRGIADSLGIHAPWN